MVLVITPAHAQDPDEVKRLCARLVEGDKYLKPFLACEPRTNEQGQKDFVAASWDRKVGTLMACRKAGRLRTLSADELDALEFCFSYR
jgi:hypothetical protein